MQVERVHFHSRRDRVAYVANRFQNLLRGKVLDIGCDEAWLKTLVQGIEHTGIDLNPKADLQLNLETLENLPFEDNSFDTVICIDVLEHLDSLHRIFHELFRVCSGCVIISWPNAWVNARRAIGRGRGSFSHYGLPVQPPADRHKWFFSITEALHFTRTVDVAPARLREAFVTEKPRPLPARLLRRLLYPNTHAYLNRYAHTLWTVFDKSA